MCQSFLQFFFPLFFCLSKYVLAWRELNQLWGNPLLTFAQKYSLQGQFYLSTPKFLVSPRWNLNSLLEWLSQILWKIFVAESSKMLVGFPKACKCSEKWEKCLDMLRRFLGQDLTQIPKRSKDLLSLCSHQSNPSWVSSCILGYKFHVDESIY